MKYCVCVSGKLGFIVLNHLFLNKIEIVVVMTDSRSTEIIEECERMKVACFVGNPRQSRAYIWLADNQIEFNHLLSINYLFILEEDILNNVSGYAINFHGSLLPKYRGRTPHVWAIINGEKQSGITAHLMNAKCDDGDIVKQILVLIEDEDTGASLLQKYNEKYPLLVDEVISDLKKGSLLTCKQNAQEATYYSKRVPEDGRIMWDWQKERIRNWVRAQAHPYPRAFAFFDGIKIVINKVEYNTLGYTDTMSNGTVIAVTKEGPVVKVQNGAILLKEMMPDIQFKINDILN